MSNKKIKSFKFFDEFLKALSKVAAKYKIPETTVVEATVEHFFKLPEDKQKEIISKYLTKNL